MIIRLGGGTTFQNDLPEGPVVSATGPLGTWGCKGPDSQS